MPPGHPPKRPKIDPSRSQEATFSRLNFDLVLGSILVSFWFPKCLPLGTLPPPQDRPKTCQERAKTAKMGPRRRNIMPRSIQDHPKTAPRPSKTDPRQPKRRPRAPQESPRPPQDDPGRPKTLKRAPQETPKNSRTGLPEKLVSISAFIPHL